MLFSKLSHNIGWTIITLYLAVSVLTLAVFGFFTYYTYRVQINGHMALEQEVGRRAVNNIDAYFKDIFEALDLTRRSLSCAGGCSATSINHKLLSSTLTVNPSIYQLILANRHGVVLASIDRSGVSGVVSSSAAEASAITASLASHSEYISAPYMSPYGVPFVTVGLPIIGEDGTVVGALVAKVDLSPMWGIVSSIVLGRTGYVYVVDKEARLLAFKNSALVQKGAVLGSVEAVKNFIAGTNHNSSLYKSFTGETVLGSWASIQTTGWGLIVELPQSELLQDLYLFITLTVVSVGLMGSFTFFLVQRIVVRLLRPVRHLHDGVRALEQGDLARRINVDTSDELGELARSFNQMAARVQESYEDLEHRVAERTSQLTEARSHLEEKFDELERLNKLMVDRELKMIELKKENEELRQHNK